MYYRATFLSVYTQAEARAVQVRTRRQELEAQIANKQLERHQLRKQLIDEQKGMDDAAVSFPSSTPG